MQITVGAKCWDGERRRSIWEPEKVEVLPIAKERIRNDPK